MSTVRIFSFVVFLCVLFAVVIPVSAATYTQYDPNQIEEMQKSGLLDPISKEQYEKEMAVLNASMNHTLGCDDFPRCNPDMPQNQLPFSPLIVLSAIGIAGFVVHLTRRT